MQQTHGSPFTWSHGPFCTAPQHSFNIHAHRDRLINEPHPIYCLLLEALAKVIVQHRDLANYEQRRTSRTGGAARARLREVECDYIVLSLSSVRRRPRFINPIRRLPFSSYRRFSAWK